MFYSFYTKGHLEMIEEKRKVNIGFLGCSRFVRCHHLQNAHFSQVCRVHTLCDINQDVLTQTNQLFPAVKTTTNAQEMLEDSEIDLVVVAMLPSLHAEMTLKAIEACKHVLVEKPMAETVEDCRKIVKRAQEKNVHVCVGFNRRFAPAIRHIKDLMENRKGPVMIEYDVVNDGFWRIGTHWLGRNGLLDEIVHLFDLTTWLVGCSPIRLFATDSSLNNNFISVEYEDGAAVMINANENGTSVAPKEIMRLTFDGHFVHMKEFVEVEDVAMDQTTIQRFAGRKYISTGSKYNSMIDTFVTGGFDSYRQVREKISRLLNANRTGQLTEDEQHDLIKNPLPPLNYSVDKGWAASLDHYAVCLMENKVPENANGYDGILATYLATQAIESARCHQVLQLDSNIWQKDQMVEKKDYIFYNNKSTQERCNLLKTSIKMNV